MMCQPQSEGHTNVVSSVAWHLEATDGTILVRTSGTTPIEFDPTSDFIDYANLTHDEVIGWVTAALGADNVAELKNGLDVQIESIITPQVVIPPLPWQ